MTVWSLVIVILIFAVAVYAYFQIPGGEVASHWNSAGEINNYISKFWGLFLVPIISLVLFLIFLALPSIDPLKNIESFRKYYDSFVLIIFIFLLYIYLLVVSFNFGYEFNMFHGMIPAIAILFFYIGVICKKLKRNWFIGIRTPWTLSSDVVWEKTHVLGSWLFKIFGVLLLVGMFFEDYLTWIILAMIVILIVGLFLYSYIIYRKMGCKKSKKDISLCR